MRILEKTLIALSIIGIGMVIMDTAAGNIFIVTGTSALACLYMFAGYWLFRDRETGRSSPALSGVAGLALAMLCVGILFKLMLWPGANFNLLIGLVPVLIILAVCIVKLKKDEALAGYYRNSITRLAIFSVVGLLLYFTTHTAIAEVRYRKDPQYARLLGRALDHPDNEQYQQELEDYVLNKLEF